MVHFDAKTGTVIPLDLNRAFERVFGPFQKSEPLTRVVLTTRKSKVKRVARSELRVVDFRELEAFAEIWPYFQERRVSCEVHPSVAVSEVKEGTEEYSLLGQRRLVVLGGPNANGTTRRALKLRRDTFPEVTLLFDRKHTKRVVGYEIDGAVYKAKLNSRKQVIVDHAVLLRTTNPFPREQGAPLSMLLAFGLHAKGTRAALSIETLKMVTQRLTTRGTSGNFMALLHFTFDGDHQPKTRIKKIWP